MKLSAALIPLLFSACASVPPGQLRCVGTGISYMRRLTVSSL